MTTKPISKFTSEFTPALLRLTGGPHEEQLQEIVTAMRKARLPIPTETARSWFTGRDPGFLWPEVTNVLAQLYEIDPVEFFTSDPQEWHQNIPDWDRDRSFSELLSDVLRQSRITQSSLVDILKSRGIFCSRQQVWYWCNGRTPKDMMFVPRLAKILGNSLGMLVPRFE